MSAKAHRKLFTMRLPATSANLGPAFDAAALAFKLFLNVRAQAAQDFSVTARGRDSALCSQLENHLILNTYRDVLAAEKRPVVPIALQIDNQIPLGKGCGSSAAARLAGIALAVHFGRLRWNDNRIIGEASVREHHPDNASACWLGGLTVARMSSDGIAQVARFLPKGKWPLLLAVPNESLPTEEARHVLPASYPRPDVVNNIQNSMLLLCAFMHGRHELLASALSDRIHQPYRAPLCPLLPALATLPTDTGILGTALSGAGPSVLIFLDGRANVSRVRLRVKAHLAAAGRTAELISTAIEARGASKIL